MSFRLPLSSEKSAESPRHFLPLLPGVLLFIGCSSEPSFSLLFLSLLELSAMRQPSENVVNVIYEYTQRLLTEEGESLTRIDNKIGIFIGFSGILIRLAYDLPHETYISFLFRCAICIFAVLSIATSSLGLLSKPSGNVVDPKELMDDKWFFEMTKDDHKAYITNGYIETLDEFEKLLARRRLVLAYVIIFFVIASCLFGFAVCIS